MIMKDPYNIINFPQPLTSQMFFLKFQEKPQSERVKIIMSFRKEPGISCFTFIIQIKVSVSVYDINRSVAHTKEM